VELVEKKTLCASYFRLDQYRLRYPLYEGGRSPEITREILERGNVSAVLLVDPDRDEVVLIEQFRIGPYAAGWEPWFIECVAGVVEKGESTRDVAIRESREEADCEVTDLFPISHFITSPGSCTESVELYCGRVDSTGAGGIHGLDAEHEDIKVMVVSVTEAVALLSQGRILNAKTIIALQWLAANYDSLKRRWCTKDD
jgi:ADP-ribose pyrophosphatase